MLTQNLKSHVDSELLFLISCCKKNPIESDAAFVLSYLNPSHVDIQRLLDLANQHGILPLVYKGLKEVLENHSDLKRDHKSILQDMKSAYLEIAKVNMLMSAELIRIINTFKTHGIEAIPFKGPTLSELIFKDITLRQYGDLDILIKKEDISKVEALCLSLGYTLHYSMTDTQKRNWYCYAKDMVFHHPKKKHYLEIHWLLHDLDFPIQLDLKSIWNRPKTVSFNTTQMNTLPTETLLLYLCIHGSRHLWERVVWIKDIDLMIRTQKVDEEKVILLAKQTNSQRMLLLGIYLSHLLFDTPVTKKFTMLMQNESLLTPLSHEIFRHWVRPLGIYQQTQVMLRLFPSLKMKIQYLHKIILKPSHNEYRFITFPKGFYWVYYLIRPYLLVKKYLFKNQ